MRAAFEEQYCGLGQGALLVVWDIQGHLSPKKGDELEASSKHYVLNLFSSALQVIWERINNAGLEGSCHFKLLISD